MQLASGTTIRHAPRTPAVTPVQVAKGDKGDTGAPGGSDAAQAGWINDSASATRAALSATYVRQRDDGRLARGCVAFSLDDGRAQNMTLAAMHESLGQRITFGIVSDWIGLTDRITSAQVLDLHNRGHEIANHSKTHMSMTTGTPATRGAEYDTCSDFIESLIGERPRTFIYPQGAWNATSDRELYGRFRSWALTASSGSNYPVYPLGGTVPRFYRIDLDNPANLDRALELVRLASRSPICVAFYTHWTDQPGTMTTAQYQSIAQLAHDLHVPAVLMRDVFGSESRLANSSFEVNTGGTIWFPVNTGAATNARTATTPDAGIAGGYVMALTAANPDTAGVSQAAAVTPGKWRVSGRVKQLTGGNLVTNDFGIRLKYRDWTEAAISQEVFYPALPATGTWGRFEQDYTVPDGTHFAYLDLLNIPGVAGRNGTVHVDHVDLRPIREGGLG